MTKVVDRSPLSFYERTYVPALVEGLKVTARHFVRTVKGNNTAKDLGDGYYPEFPWRVNAGYRGAPYLVRDQDGATKCVSCQLCEFVCPPKAIKITPPGPDGPKADRLNAEKIPLEFEINMLRCIFCGYCEDACPTQAIELGHEHQLSFTDRENAIFDKKMLIDPPVEGAQASPQVVEPGVYTRSIPDMEDPK